MAEAWTEDDEREKRGREGKRINRSHSRNSEGTGTGETDLSGKLPHTCGYVKSIFVKDPDPKYTCSYGDHLLKDPVQSICGHRYCKPCLDELLKDAAPVCKACVAEGEPGTITDKAGCGFPDKAILREMKLQDSRCPHEGCSWQGKFSQYLEHELSCVLRQVLCRDCNKWVAEKDLSSHRDPESGDCIKVRCPFGCDANSNDTHQNESIVQHSHVLLDKINQIQAEITLNGPKNLNSAGQNYDTKLRQLEERLEELSTHPGNFTRQGASSIIASSIESSRGSAVVGSTGEIVSLEEYQKLREKVALNESLIAVLNRETEKLITEQNNLEHKRDQSNSELENLQGKLVSFERMLALKDIDLAEKSLRIEALESTSYDGTLMWKIKDVHRQRQNAISGRNLSIYSAPFYTSKSGYKICARIYLNGDGMGRGTHLSLFFVIMKGQFDPILTWPFPHRVTFTLLSQTGNDHIFDGFRPDPTSSSFRRPTSNMNVASGMPVFCPLNNIEDRNSKYVKDDTMFIKVQVFCKE